MRTHVKIISRHTGATACHDLHVEIPVETWQTSQNSLFPPAFLVFFPFFTPADVDKLGLKVVFGRHGQLKLQLLEMPLGRFLYSALGSCLA